MFGSVSRPVLVCVQLLWSERQDVCLCFVSTSHDGNSLWELVPWLCLLRLLLEGKVLFCFLAHARFCRWKPFISRRLLFLVLFLITRTTEAGVFTSHNSPSSVRCHRPSFPNEFFLFCPRLQVQVEQTKERRRFSPLDVKLQLLISQACHINKGRILGTMHRGGTKPVSSQSRRGGRRRVAV